jgi:hypothetical protein
MGNARRALLTVHIVASVGLLGVIAADLAINVAAAAATDDPAQAAAYYDLLATFSFLFGIPLSFTSLGTGVVLGRTSKWGVVRHGWVAAKLALNVSVILVGAFLLGPGVDQMRSGDGGVETALIAGSAWDVVALLLAATLGVYKPRRLASLSLR